MKKTIQPLLAMTLILALIGCREDERVVRVAQEAANRQAEQNKEMASLNREVAEGTKRLVQADAESRRELVALQHDLRADHAKVAESRDALEEERKAMAANRHRDPIIANSITAVGVLLACLLPLLLCWRLLRDVHDEKDDAVIAEILIEELGSENRSLLPPFADERNAIESQRSPHTLLTVEDDPGKRQASADERDESGNS